MHYAEIVLRVIFMLSTIVVVTDCCSSRILLLRDQALQFVEQQRIQPQVDSGEVDFVQDTIKTISQHAIEFNSTDINENFEKGDGNTTVAPIETDDIINPTEIYQNLNMNFNEDIEQALIPLGGLLELPNPILPISYLETNSTTDNNKNPNTFPKNEQSFATLSNLKNCSGLYDENFCLNGRCFEMPIGRTKILSCACEDGFMGERCESKSVNGIYEPIAGITDAKPPKILMARFMFSFPMLITLSTIYIAIGAWMIFKCPHKLQTYRPQQQYRASGMLIG